MYAIRYTRPEQLYLWVSRNPVQSSTSRGGRERRLIVDVNKATHWDLQGHAIAALDQAMDAGVIPKTAVVEIVPLAIRVSDAALPRKVRRAARRPRHSKAKFETVE